MFGRQLATKAILFVALLSVVSVSCKMHKKQIELPTISESLIEKTQTKDISLVQKNPLRFNSRKQTQLEQTTSAIETRKDVKRVEKRNSSVVSEVVIGAILFFSGFPCLWFNEKGYAYTQTFLRKYVKVCKDIKADEIDPALEDQLVSVQGSTVSEQPVKDPIFEIEVPQSIKLNRSCEMYQWTEERNTRRISDDQDEVYYTYHLKWVSHFVESSCFVEKYGHENNQQNWMYDSLVTTSPHVTYGQFKLSESQKLLCHSSVDVPVTAECVALMAQKHNLINIVDVEEHGNQVQVESAKMVSQHNGKSAKAKQNVLSIAYNQSHDSIGDFRVRFTHTPCGPITVVGQQKIDTLETFTPEEHKQNVNIDDIQLDGGCCGCCSTICKACEAINAPISQINWVSESHKTKQEMFNKALSDYETKTWLFRLAGFLCFAVGIYLMLSPVYTFMYWFPLVGRYLGTVGSFICGLIGFLIAIPLTILTISIAWLFYRKEIGIPLLILSIILIWYFTSAYQSGEPTQSQEAVTKV